jgi:TolA-binding protein
MLASAQDQYRAGKYGRAIVEFSDIGKNFGNKVEGGLHQYWIAKSWIGLKEYNTARQQLQDFLKDYASSPWVPRAKLDLAKVEWRLGLQETAIQRFREIIQSYPYEDAAEMAKTELSHLDKAL